MKRTAILSDVHSNIEALEAVLVDAEENGCAEIVCLGDLVGYGPNPREVVKVAMEAFRFTLMGNHEEAVLFSPDGFNWKAAQAATWTKKAILGRRSDGATLWEYLLASPKLVRDGDVLYVHASPVDPQREYILPESVYNAGAMRNVFARIKRVAFGGHTHLPGVFLDGPAFIPQDRIDGPFPVLGGKFFVNVGSVGQPRDGDARACYAIFDGTSVIFRRVRYNFRLTQRKIRRISALHGSLAARLQFGL